MPGKRKAGTVSILLRMQDADKKRIDEAARQAGMTTSDLARTAIFAYVDLLEKAQPKKSSE